MQIEKLGVENEPLATELLENAIKAISFNPSVTLEGKHGDKPPLVRVAEKLFPDKKENK